MTKTMAVVVAVLVFLSACAGAQDELLDVDVACAEQAEAFCARIEIVAGCRWEGACEESHARTCELNRTELVAVTDQDACLDAIEAMDVCSYGPPSECVDLWFDSDVVR